MRKEDGKMKPLETQTRKRIRGSWRGVPIWIQGAE